MHLREFFTPGRVDLHLDGGSRHEVLEALIELLEPDDRARTVLSRTLHRRESLGSTGIGRGIAIPHCRSLVVTRLHMAYGRHLDGVDFGSIDNRPARHFFLIVAPPLEVSGQYLPALGKVAQFAKEADVPDRLAALGSPTEFFDLLDSKGV